VGTINPGRRPRGTSTSSSRLGCFITTGRGALASITSIAAASNLCGTGSHGSRRTIADSNPEEQMATKTQSAKTITAKVAKRRVDPDVPRLFRLNVEVGDLDQAVSFTASCSGSRDESKRARAATSRVGRSRCRWSTCHLSDSRTRRRRRCISRSTTSTLSSRARKRLAASLERMYTASPAAPSACGHGASARSTSRIAGRIRCASSRLGQSIRAEIQRRIAPTATVPERSDGDHSLRSTDFCSD
jgi:hypothetical protein